MTTKNTTPTKPLPLQSRFTITVASTCKCDDDNLEDAELGDHLRRCYRCRQITTIGLVETYDSLDELVAGAEQIAKELG